MNRRAWLCSSAAAAAAAFFGVPTSAVASMEEVDALIAEFANGLTTGEDAALQMSIPEIAENGHSVPVSFIVESPMSEEDHVMSVMLLASDNPNPEVITFHFTPANGIAKVSTRMRLARTQDVVAVAKTSSGKLHRTSRNVHVVIGGCGV